MDSQRREFHGGLVVSKEGESETLLVSRKLAGKGEQSSANERSAIYSLIEHHDKRTLTVGGGACESVQNQFPFALKSIMDACTHVFCMPTSLSEIPCMCVYVCVYTYTHTHYPSHKGVNRTAEEG